MCLIEKPTPQDFTLIRISADQFLNFVNSFPMLFENITIACFNAVYLILWATTTTTTTTTKLRFRIAGKKFGHRNIFIVLYSFVEAKCIWGTPAYIRMHRPYFAAQEKDNGRVAHHRSGWSWRAGRSKRKEEYNNIISPPAPNQRHRRAIADVAVTCLERVGRGTKNTTRRDDVGRSSFHVGCVGDPSFP